MDKQITFKDLLEIMLPSQKVSIYNGDDYAMDIDVVNALKYFSDDVLEQKVSYITGYNGELLGSGIKVHLIGKE